MIRSYSIVSSYEVRRERQDREGEGGEPTGGTNRCARIHAVAARPHCRLTVSTPTMHKTGSGKRCRSPCT
ncbi:hypothetical protein DPEC_G00164120 [Dallia pectoralis]|uniref:Uncharacterized protein n=1 Tax=Dallia pectoralis TaxID=75939 RepID=A0ACC2GH07_DALPE|nr:hypothetical protein DPEC_G00164120 [Dallia pectoralis]